MEKKRDKTLYVCRANIGRSQVAMTYHNDRAPGRADSAGIKISEVEAEHLEDWEGSQVVIQVMKERGFDISKNTRRQIDRADAYKYGKVVLLAELEVMPLWLLEVKPEIWKVPDLKDLDVEKANKIIDEISIRVGGLLERDGFFSYKPLPQASLSLER